MGRAGERLWKELDDVSARSRSTTFEADEDNAGPASVTPGYKTRPITELGTAGLSSPSPLHPFLVVHRESYMRLSMPTSRIRSWADLVIYLVDQAELRRSPCCRSRGCRRHHNRDSIGCRSSNMAFIIGCGYETGLAETRRTVCT
jgi:hypothetical protein